MLNQPFPAYQSGPKVFLYTFYAGLVVFLILVLFRPFGFGHTPAHLIYLYALFFGIATFVMASLNSMLLPRLFPKAFDEQQWTTGKELLMMLWQIVSVSLVNFLLMHLLYGEPVSFAGVVKTLGITAAVGLFPVTLVVLLKQQILLKKYTAGAAELEEELPREEPAEAEANPAILFNGDNHLEELLVPVNYLRYVTSADNYIKVYYLEGHQLTSQVLRSTLKKAEETVKAHPQLFRCHRAYLVNLSFVTQVSGNAQGYKLHLRDCAEPIPVSRSLNAELKQHIEQFRVASHSSQ